MTTALVFILTLALLLWTSRKPTLGGAFAAAVALAMLIVLAWPYLVHLWGAHTS